MASEVLKAHVVGWSKRLERGDISNGTLSYRTMVYGLFDKFVHVRDIEM
jgi:hypothetical protein